MAEITTVPSGRLLTCTWGASVTEMILAGTLVAGVPAYQDTFPCTLAPPVPVGSFGDGYYRDQSIFQDSAGQVHKVRSNYSSPATNYASTFFCVERMYRTSSGGAKWLPNTNVEVGSKIALTDSYVNLDQCVTSSPEFVNDVTLSGGRKRVVNMFQAAGMSASLAPASNSLLYYQDSTDSTLSAWSDPTPITGTAVPVRLPSTYVNVPTSMSGTITQIVNSSTFRDSSANFAVKGGFGPVQKKDADGADITGQFVSKWWVRITSGAAAGTERLIDGGTDATGIGLASAFTTVPSVGDTYTIFAKVASIIDPAVYQLASGKWVLLGSPFVEGNDRNTRLPPIYLLSDTDSVSGYNTAGFLQEGNGPWMFVEGPFLLKNSGDNSLTFGGDPGEFSPNSLTYTKTGTGVVALTRGMFNTASPTLIALPAGVTDAHHASPFVLTAAIPASLNLEPVDLVTAFTLTGPSSGVVGVESANFNVKPTGGTAWTGTITMSDGGAGGTFTPTSLSWTGDVATKTFTYTPAGANGSRSITATASPTLTAPSALAYAVSGGSSGDTTAPTLASAAVNTAGTVLTVSFTEAGSPPLLPATAAAGVTLSGGHTLSAGTRVGSTGAGAKQYTFPITPVVFASETLTTGYSGSSGNITDSAGTPNEATTVSGVAVTNGSTQTAPVDPDPGTGTSSADTLRLLTVQAPEGGTQYYEDGTGDLIRTRTYKGNVYATRDFANGSGFTSTYTPAEGD